MEVDRRMLTHLLWATLLAQVLWECYLERAWEPQNTQVTLHTWKQCLELGQSVQVRHNSAKLLSADLEVQLLARAGELERMPSWNHTLSCLQRSQNNHPLLCDYFEESISGTLLHRRLLLSIVQSRDTRRILDQVISSPVGLCPSSPSLLHGRSLLLTLEFWSPMQKGEPPNEQKQVNSKPYKMINSRQSKL